LDAFASFIVRRRKPIVALFLVLAILVAPLSLLVKVNYNIIDYLPQSAQSTVGVQLMTDEFATAVPNASIMVHDVSIPEALAMKERIAAIDGIKDVMWLDDVVDVRQPLEIADPDTVESYYKDGTALYTVNIYGNELDVTTALPELVGEDNAVGGEAPSMGAMQDAAVSEVLGAFAILIPAIILILALSTSSWVEPVLLLVNIAVAVLLNMGTNVVYTDISFVTNTVSPILQLAVSMDYAIFLLHSFADYRQVYDDVGEAMQHAIKTSFGTVAASGATTLFGFLALVFMEFLIGADLGINLAKGIIFSFITSMVFLPALTLGAYKLMDRTAHRPLLPSFANCGRVLVPLGAVVTLLVVVAVVPSYLGQSRTDFLYGADGASQGTRAGADAAAIEEEFGKQNIVVTLVPKGDTAKEKLLSAALDERPHVTAVVSYAQSVGSEIPSQILPDNVSEQFFSEDFSRIVVYTDTASEGDEAFAMVGDLRQTVAEYYPEGAYTLGRSANLLDMKTVVQSDNLRVNWIAVIAIFLVLLVTFRSAVLPFLLLLTIESAIWINLAVPYFTDTQINYIGYLVLNTVQLGATVDYAILLTNTYLRYRRDRPRKAAVHDALGTSFKSILVSASTLTIAGFALWGTSTNPIVCDIGLMLGRGTILSFTLVVCFLPLMLLLFDPLIGKLTRGAQFLKKSESN